MPDDRTAAKTDHVAEAFSRHDFDGAYPFLSDDVVWELVGDRSVVGKDEVIAVCQGTTRDLVGVTTTFETFRAIRDDQAVVIDSEAHYVDDEGASFRVASCDIYDFRDGRLVAIRSYTVELH